MIAIGLAETAAELLTLSAQDKKLTDGEIKKLEDAGLNPHELKEGYGPPSRFDLYKDRDGNIIVKPKGGGGTGEPIGYNIKDLP